MQNFAPREQGKTRDIVAKETGFGSGENYRKAQYIYENGSEELCGVRQGNNQWTPQNVESLTLDKFWSRVDSNKQVAEDIEKVKAKKRQSCGQRGSLLPQNFVEANKMGGWRNPTLYIF